MRKNIISFLGTVFIEEVLFSSLTFSQFQGFSNFKKKKKVILNSRHKSFKMWIKTF